MTHNAEADIPLKPGCVPECPGYAHKYLTREQSLAQKKWVKNKLASWKTKFDPIQTNDEKSQWEYRKKVCLTTQWDQGTWKFGLIKNKTVNLIHTCPVHTRQIQAAVSLFSSRLPATDLFPLAVYVQTGNQITLMVIQHPTTLPVSP